MVDVHVVRQALAPEELDHQTMRLRRHTSPADLAVPIGAVVPDPALRRSVDGDPRVEPVTFEVSQPQRWRLTSRSTCVVLR
jgi:hypothetical protein